MIKILDSNGKWELEVDSERMCIAEGVSFIKALDIFAANYPEHAAELDELNPEDLMGVVVTGKVKRQGGERAKRGSGARFRELIMAGKNNADALAIVRAEFPDSKATLSDAAWNRALLRKGMFTSDGRKI